MYSSGDILEQSMNTKHRHCVRVTEDEGEAFGGTKSIPIVSNLVFAQHLI